jgi:anti-anti-sigma factor
MIVNIFDWKVRKINDWVVIDLIGDLDSKAVEGFREAIMEAVQLKNVNGGLLLNFSKTGYINSGGIALIIGLLTQARKNSTQLSACGLNKHYQNLFRITRLSDFIRIFEDEESAVAELMKVASQ